MGSKCIVIDFKEHSILNTIDTVLFRVHHGGHTGLALLWRRPDLGALTGEARDDALFAVEAVVADALGALGTREAVVVETAWTRPK